MKRLFTTLIGFCFLAIIATTGFAGEQQWTFDSNAEGWTAANGTWSVADGAYKLAVGGAAEHSLVGDVAWDDYTVEAKVRLDEGSWAGIAFRAKSEREYYVFYLNVPNNKTELWRHKTPNWDSRDNLAQLPAKNVTIANGEWFNMKIDVAGDTMALSINGEMQGEFTDDSGGKYSAGQAGLWGWQTGASFDDFKVSGDAIVGSVTPVEPLDKLTTTWGRIKDVR